MDARKPSWKAWCHGLLYMLSVMMLISTSQAHVQGGHHKRVERSSFQAAHPALFDQVSSIPAPGLDRREMQTIVLTTTISTYIELGIPCDATEIPQSMSSLLTRPPPLSIPTSLGTIATGVFSLTAPDGSSPAPSQTSTLSSTSAVREPKSSSSNSLSSSQTSSISTTGTQSSTIDHTSTADSSSAPAVPDTSIAASRSTTEPSKPATSTSTATSITNIRISTQSISSGTTESSVALPSSSSTRNITTVVVSSTIVVLWPGTESTSSVDDSTTSAPSKTKHTAWVTQTSQETVTEWIQPSLSSSSSSSTSSSSLSSSSSNSARTAWVTKTAKATVTEWFDPPAVAPSSYSTSTTPDGPAVVVVTASAQATITQFHDSTQTVIVSPSPAPASPDVHPRLPTDSNLPGPTKRIVRFSQRIWYTENKHQIMVIATYEDNHVVTVYTAPERTDLPAVLVLDDQNGNKRGSLKMTFRMGFFTIDFRSEMAGRVVEWDNHWTKNEADEDAPWCETVFLKDDGKERLAREIWCYYTA
ncbi:hypothetical protein K4K58_010904 [Colletotrichum sp. SAR11_239]|nr:hypothetical protein K4K58_010904 [Colletotrichum sp. SAR11_239]